MTDTQSSAGASHRIFRKFAYLFSAHGIRQALETVFLIYLARHSSETYGQFMLAISVGQIMLFVAEFGLNQHLATLLARKKHYPSVILMQVTLVKSILLGLSWLGMLIFIFWQGYTPEMKMLVIIISTGIGLEALASSFYVACQVLDRQDVEGRWRSIAAFAGYGFGIATLVGGMNSIVVAFYMMIETTIAISGAGMSILRRARARIKPEQIKLIWKTWRGGLVYTLMAIAAIFYNKLNLFFLQKYGGAVGVAQYSVTWQLVDGLSVMVSGMLLRRVLFPLFVKLWVSNRQEFFDLARNTSRWLIATALPVMFILAVESDRMIPLIFGDGYSDAIWMQRYLVGCIFFAFIHNLAHYLMISIQRERLLLIFYLLGLAFNLVCCIVLIPKYPLLGTALSIVMTKGFVALMTVTFCQFRLRMIPLAGVFHIVLAVAAGALLYVVGIKYLFREAGELLALAPMLFLAWQWRRSLTQRTQSII